MATNACQASSRRLFVTDRATKTRYLVDTGSDLCVLPRTLAHSHHEKTDYKLCAANGSVINTYGDVTLNLDFGLRRSFQWRFVIANVATPILGADFLSYYDLMVDIRNARLVDRLTSLSVDGVTSTSKLPSVKTITITGGNSLFARILEEFPSLTRPPGVPQEVKHSTMHYIRTTPGPPVTCRPRRLRPDLLAEAKSEFDDMVKAGKARPSSSSWSSPLHMVPKKEANKKRPCGDYRALNSRTIPDKYSPRYIADYSSNLAGCTIFSRVDLVKAFLQIPVFPGDVEKTAITTPFGLYEFLFMAFGLRNASQTFQRFIDEVCRGLNFCFPFIDDILVASRTPQEHEEHLRTLFKRLEDYGVVLNAAKCELGVPELTFLGYRISAAGSQPPAERVAAIRQFPRPSTFADLRRFLGALNFYRRFLPHAAGLQAPLTNLLGDSTQNKGAKPILWTPELNAAFEACKESLASNTLLAHPRGDVMWAVFTDASSTSMGGVLQQRVDGAWQPLSFFSRKLKPTQRDWPAFHRELLAGYESFKYFRDMLETRHFVWYTDHKPLQYAFTQRRDRLPPVQLNQLAFMAQFTTDVRHVSGAENVVADFLSRVEAVSRPVDAHDLAVAQQNDAELAELLRSGSSSLKLQKIAIPGSDMELYCDVSTSKPRPFVPVDHRRDVFDALHGLSHPGARPTVKLVTQRYVWPGIRQDCRAWTRSCCPCQRSKVVRHTSAPLGDIVVPPTRFNHVHIDLVGPLPSCKGNQYLLTMIDRFTRWLEVYPLSDITADSVAWAFLFAWVARFGVPVRLTADRGRQFTSATFEGAAKMCGTKLIHTTAYHPQSNGMIESVHRPLKAALMCHEGTPWMDALPWVLLGLRAALKEDIGCSSADLVLGEPLRLPGDFFVPPDSAVTPSDTLDRLRAVVSRLRPRPASRHDSSRTFVSPDLGTVQHVFLRQDAVRPSLSGPYRGPYRVLRRDAKTMTLDVGNRHTTVSIDRVKPAFLVQDVPTTSGPSTPVTTPAPATEPTSDRLAPPPVIQAKTPPPALKTSTAASRFGRPLRQTRFYIPG